MDNFDADLALAFYTHSFADPAKWRFVFSGNLEPALLTELVVKYLGSIPPGPRPPPAGTFVLLLLKF